MILLVSVLFIYSFNKRRQMVPYTVRSCICGFQESQRQIQSFAWPMPGDLASAPEFSIDTRICFTTRIWYWHQNLASATEFGIDTRICFSTIIWHWHQAHHAGWFGARRKLYKYRSAAFAQRKDIPNFSLPIIEQSSFWSGKRRKGM